MNVPEQIAQWVIDNRYPKSENNKVSDFEMFTTIVEKINGLTNNTLKLDCSNCIFSSIQSVEPCCRCTNFDMHQLIF